MEREVFNTLKIGASISEPRGREAPPIKGTLADKVGETALVRTGYTLSLIHISEPTRP